MLHVHCSGTPHEIGYQHGLAAFPQVARSLKFYADLFRESTKLEWSEVTKVAATFEPSIKEKWPRYWQEMRGLAEGAQVPPIDIIALNVRTEINYGLFTDGCTAMSWHSSAGSYLAQNWDWREEQIDNLVMLTVEQSDMPTIKMITEAGIIGKIGLNSAGIGVCLNAIRAHGVNTTRLPCHLGLRLALECTSIAQAGILLQQYGIASSCHFLLADGVTGGVGLEWSAKDCQLVQQDMKGRVFHTNHYILDHPEVVESVFLRDSVPRLSRIEHLADQLQEAKVDLEALKKIFQDEEGFPSSICRKHEPPHTDSATLFNIVMDLQQKRAVVTIGRPIAYSEQFEMSF